ncbi:MCE family protein [Mumia sp. zg.B53]|uniref:MCE family protein n=1 Tax=unclassified Mumia TaxID=2621872 RepID=UPI001C6E4194|nr:MULTISPECIES: MCE family protein [unclassified Mumia]MBW9209340.1 MCE family protein [Mumia sp. zg.B21]MBW9213949.1 MCE family protein [Mumia sp. zg.B53]MDD9349858.1 MCE family protein [Mumia sp.]
MRETFGRARAAVVLAAALVLTAGCGRGSVGDLPLPGGADLGDDPYTVVVEFEDVLDLVPQSAVKVNDVSVGRVTDVALDGWQAVVTMKVNGDVELPDNALAAIRQTSILGEKFVSLAPPPSGAQGRLSEGDRIPLVRSGHTPEVEQVLGALSLVLNGGAVDKIQVIARELNAATTGREANMRTLLRRLDEFVGTAEASKKEIVVAIEQIDALAKATRTQQSAIDDALDDLPAALQTVNAQRANLVRMLGALNTLSGVGTEVIVKSKQSVVADLKALNPVLDNLASAGDALISSLEVLPTFPFPDSLLGDNPEQAAAYQMGDYTNVSLDFTTDFTKTIGLMTEAERASLKAALRSDDVAGVMARTVVAP